MIRKKSHIIELNGVRYKEISSDSDPEFKEIIGTDQNNCKHKWEMIKSYSTTGVILFFIQAGPIYHYAIFRCKKCGKTKKEQVGFDS